MGWQVVSCSGVRPGSEGTVFEAFLEELGCEHAKSGVNANFWVLGVGAGIEAFSGV